MNARGNSIQAIHAYSVALGARCNQSFAASGRRTQPVPLGDLTRRLEGVDAELRALVLRLSRLEQKRASASGGRGFFGKAGYNPDEPRDAHGRWTNSGSGTASARHGGLLGHLGRHPFMPAVYRPGKDRPWFTPVAGGGEEEREDLEEEFLDPTGELRAELFGLAYRDLKAIDPINPALEMITPTGWVPSWRDVQDLSDTLEAAKATRDMELNGEPPPNIWELGWGARGVAAERMRGTSLPQNFPTIDRFANGIAISIKSIDLNAPSYQEPWRLEARINYYVNRLAAFNGERWGDDDIQLEDIRGRSLDLIVPRGSLSPDREATIARCRIRAQGLGIGIVTVQY